MISSIARVPGAFVVHYRSYLGIGFVCCVVGCAGSSGPVLPKTVPVKGVVTLDGKPLTNAMIVFIPTGSTTGIGSSGYTDKDGKFELQTASGSVKTPGAPPGDYRVVANKFKNPDGTEFPADSKEGPATSRATETLPMHISDYIQGGTRATVPAAGGEVPIAFVSTPGAGGAPGMPGGGMMPR